MSRLYKKDDDVIVTNDSLHKVYSKIVNTVEGLTVEIQDSGGSLMIIVRGDENFEGCDITALCKLDNREYTKTLVNGTAVFKVKLPGEYFITNTHSDATITCYVGEPFIDEVYFTDFYGSINVTIPELLIGETLEAKNGEHTVEKEINSTVEILDIYNSGTWSVGIKGTEFITPQETTLTEMGESKTVQLSIDGAAYITVTLADEIKDERITCKNNEEFTRTKTPIDGKVHFFVPTLANYTVCLEISDLIKKEVNVEAQQEYEVTLDLNDLTVPVLLVTSKPDYEGYTINVSRGNTTLEKKLKNGTALYIIEEKGEYTISCDLVPDRIRKVQITENKLYKIRYGAYIFGIRVKKEEPDPEKRVEVIEDTDLYGLRPIKATKISDEYTIDYGDMKDTFLFKALNNPVLLSIDGQEEIELDPNDYSKRKAGGNAPSATINDDYNQFNRIDKLYSYMYDDNTYEYYFISEDKVDENYTAVGFTLEDDSEADCFYYGSFFGSMDSQGRFRSISGVNMAAYYDFKSYTGASRKTGDGYTLIQWQFLVFLRTAYLMLVQNYDKQQSFAYGRHVNGGNKSGHYNNAKTGLSNNQGPVACINLSDSQPATNTEFDYVKFMHIEDYCTGEGHNYFEGMITNKYITYYRMKPPYITTEGGDLSTYTPFPRITDKNPGNSWIKYNAVSNQWGMIPLDASGSKTTYTCSNFAIGLNTTRYNMAAIGQEGAFQIYTGHPIIVTSENESGYSGPAYNARLCYLPPKKS